MGYFKDKLITLLHDCGDSQFKTNLPSIIEVDYCKIIKPTYSYNKLFKNIKNKFQYKCNMHGIQVEDLIQDIALSCLESNQLFKTYIDAYKFYCNSMRRQILWKIRDKKNTIQIDNIEI